MYNKGVNRILAMYVVQPEYLAALARVNDRHQEEETCRRDDWDSLNETYTKFLVGNITASTATAIFKRAS